jgi:hypothetical protein
MLTVLAFAAAAAAHAGIPYDPPTTPFDNPVARVQLSAGKPGEVTKPHVHLTNRVMIYFEAGTNTIRYPNGKIAPEHFRAGDVQWNDAMGTHTATITAAGPVDIVHVELKRPEHKDGRVHAILYGPRDPLTSDPKHFKLEMQKDQVRVLRLHLGKGEKTQAYQTMFEHLLVPLTAASLKTADAKGVVKEAAYRKGEVQWRMPGIEADENTGGKPYEAILVEFQK